MVQWLSVFVCSIVNALLPCGDLLPGQYTCNKAPVSNQTQVFSNSSIFFLSFGVSNAVLTKFKKFEVYKEDFEEFLTNFQKLFGISRKVFEV